jgi:CHAT domain-containing protein/tetratricopeptide (TPR) repeat protein
MPSCRGWASLAVLAVAVAWLPAAAAHAEAARRVPALVDSLWDAGSRDSAQAVLARWIPRARVSRDSALLRALLVREGGHLVSFGEVRGAERALREAAALAEAGRDTATLLGAVRWLSVAVGGQGRMAEAHALYLRLRELAVRRGHARYEAWALIGLAWEANQAGRMSESAALARRAAGLFARAGDAQGEIWARNALGTALSELGEFRESMDCFRRSAAVARRVGFTMVEALAVNNLADLEYDLGDPGRALEHFRRALEIARRIRQGREAITPETNIAICLRDLGRLDEADSVLAACIAECAAGGYLDLESTALLNRAGVRRLQHRPHAALALYRSALGLGPGLTLRDRLECRVGLSNALAEMDSGAAACSVARSAVALLAGGRGGEMRPVVYRALAERLFEGGDAGGSLRVAREAERAVGRASWSGLRVRILALVARDERALGHADRARAVLREAAASWERERVVPRDPEWREQRGESGALVFGELAGLLLEDSSATAEARTEATFDVLQRFKTRTLLERMRGPGAFDERSSRALDSTVTMGVLRRRLLGERDLFLDFHLGRERSLLFAVTRRESRVVPLPREAELEERIRTYRELLAAPAGVSRSAQPAAARAISRLLFGGIEDLLAASSRVLVSPDGAVNLLPLAELPAPDGEPRLLRQEWTRVPSATVLARLAGRARLAIDAQAAAILTLTGSDRLPGAAREAADLTRTYQHVLAGDPALDALEAGPGAPAFEVVHFAAHLSLDPQHPWRSALHLATPDSALVFEAATMARRELPARLAVLSSCTSAGGRILSGEGVLGYSSALLGAGVPAVVATLWPVDDGATVLFTRLFYAELARGAGAATALRQAQLTLRSRPATRDARYWAGFVVIGDGDVRVHLRRRWTALPLVPPALVLLGLALGALALRGGRRPAESTQSRASV